MVACQDAFDAETFQTLIWAGRDAYQGDRGHRMVAENQIQDAFLDEGSSCLADVEMQNQNGDGTVVRYRVALLVEGAVFGCPQMLHLKENG